MLVPPHSSVCLVGISLCMSVFLQAGRSCGCSRQPTYTSAAHRHSFYPVKVFFFPMFCASSLRNQSFINPDLLCLFVIVHSPVFCLPNFLSLPNSLSLSFLSFQPESSVLGEEVLLAIGDQVGHSNLSYASRINRGVVVFFKEERLVAELVVRAVTLTGAYLQDSPLAVPSLLISTLYREEHCIM